MTAAVLTPEDARGRITPQIVARYTQGDCGILAHYLAAANGWGVCVVGELDLSEYDPDDPVLRYIGVDTLIHAYAVRGDGMLVDVRGVHHPDVADELANRWGVTRHDYPDAATADRYWNHEQWFGSWGHDPDDDLLFDDDGCEVDEHHLATGVAELVTAAYGTAGPNPPEPDEA